MDTHNASVETVLVYNLGGASSSKQVHLQQEKTGLFYEQTCENASVKPSQHVLVHSPSN